MNSNEWNPKDVAALIAFHKWASSVTQHEGEHADDNPDYDWAEAEDMPTTTFTVGQRVTLEYYGKQRVGTVMQIWAASGYVHVAIDGAWMYEWVAPEALT